jgi:hypothetical protein
VIESQTSCAFAVEVGIFGSLQRHRLKRRLPCRLTVEVPQSGLMARGLAIPLGLPPEEIEVAFVNHIVRSTSARGVFPGDRVAFVPYGTPGPHRLYLGLYNAGKGS